MKKYPVIYKKVSFSDILLSNSCEWIYSTRIETPFHNASSIMKQENKNAINVHFISIILMSLPKQFKLN